MKEKTIVKKISDGARFYLSGASVKGINKEENQDDFEVGYFKEGQAAYIVVADGLGSCKYSSEGAKLVTKLVADWVKNDLLKYDKLSDSVNNIFNKRLLERWRKELEDKNIYEFDTTVHYAIYYKDSVLVGGIGDGMAIATIDNFEGCNYISEKGYFGNVTNSIASDEAITLFEDEIINVSNVKDKLVVVLATDGITEDIIPEKRYTLPGYFYESLCERGIDSLKNEIIEWISNWKTTGHSDDKTICIMIIDKSGE